MFCDTIVISCYFVDLNKSVYVAHTVNIKIIRVDSLPNLNPRILGVLITINSKTSSDNKSIGDKINYGKLKPLII